jgi:hypothetical protein
MRRLGERVEPLGRVEHRLGRGREKTFLLKEVRDRECAKAEASGVEQVAAGAESGASCHGIDSETWCQST